EFGSRYANANDSNLIAGYRKMGLWALIIYILIVISTMFFVAGAVGAVTGGFFSALLNTESIFGENAGLYTTLFVFIVSVFVLWIGKYKSLEKGIKYLGIILLSSTLLCFCMVIFREPEHIKSLPFQQIWPESNNDWLFLLALMGWMPTAVDLSTWNSLWTMEQIKLAPKKIPLKITLKEFRLGYWISAGLAICFVVLGAKILNGSTSPLPKSPVKFANEVINLFCQVIGSWSRPLIAIAASSIMLGTCIAVFDGYSRSLTASIKELRLFSNQRNTEKTILLITMLGSLAIVIFFGNKLTALVDVATSLSFLVAPFIALANLYLVTNKRMPSEAKPSVGLTVLSIAGVVYLFGFSLIYVIQTWWS
ncbi:MAG: divalent metal cation transporter, partial [Flavobacteriales bacterium]|nr:divalent metal cation transporter [Flavobacteriales bacterium]